MNVEELREAFFRLPELEIAPVYTWQRHRRSLKSHVRRDDPLEFLRWSTLVATMFVGNAPYIVHEFEELNTKRWTDAIEEPWFGNAIPYEYARYTSGNLIHQAYHLKVFEDFSGIRINDLNSIYEFGGGYGAMALIARNLGFTGKYVIHDLPEFSLLQEFYLSNIGIEAELVTELPDQKDYDLFIGCFSISETSLPFRERIFDAIHTDAYMLVFQHVWEGINNDDYFYDFVERKSMNYELKPMTHMESGPNYHLVMWS